MTRFCALGISMVGWDAKKLSERQNSSNNRIVVFNPFLFIAHSFFRLLSNRFM